MLTQPVRVRKNGIIDDRYRWDDVDEMMYQADKVLMAPVLAGNEYEDAKERYTFMNHKVQGISGYDYSKRDKYGCCIMGSGYNDHDLFADLAEAEELVKETNEKYHKLQEDCKKLLRECTDLTEEQRNALETRYCGGTQLLGYEVIAALNGLTNYKQAYCLWEKGYEVFTLWLNKKQSKEEYNRRMGMCVNEEEGILYTSRLIG